MVVLRLSLAVGLLILLCVAALAPSAHAADAALPGTTWYVHKLTDPIGTGTFLDFLPPEGETDQASTGDPSPSPLTITIAEAAASAVPYTGVGTAGEALLWMKGFNNAPSPGTKVTVEVLAGTVSLAKNSVTHDIVNPTGSITEYRIPLTVAATAIPAGAKVSMVVTMENSACGCFTSLAYPRGVSPDHAWQVRLPFVQQLPAAGGAVATVHATDRNATFHHAWTFANATTANYHYNWTNGPAAANVTLRLAGNGTASVRVVDAANRTVARLNGTGPMSVPTNGTAGNWTVLVSFTAFKGNATLDIAPPGAPSPTPGSTGTGTVSQSGTTAPASGATSGPGSAASSSASRSGTSSAGTPGLPLAGLVAGLGLAVLARRRC